MPMVQRSSVNLQRNCSGCKSAACEIHSVNVSIRERGGETSERSSGLSLGEPINGEGSLSGKCVHCASCCFKPSRGCVESWPMLHAAGVRRCYR